MKLALPPSSPKNHRTLLAIFTVLFFAIVTLVAYFWYIPGKLILQGTIPPMVQSLSMERSGTIAKIFVTEGSQVKAGDILLQLDDGTIRDEIIQEQEKLMQIEANLGAQLLQVATIKENPEDLKQQMQADEEAEAAAYRNMQDASAEEASAAVALRRAMILYGRQNISTEQYQEVIQKHQRARQVLDTLKKEYEQSSTRHAETSVKFHFAEATKELRVKYDIQLKAHELQRFKVQSLITHLEAMALHAPANGRISSVLLKAGNTVAAREPIIYFLAQDTGEAHVFAGISEQKAKKLREGQDCQVGIELLGDVQYAGNILSIRPKQKFEAADTTENSAIKNGYNDDSKFEVVIAVKIPQLADKKDSAKKETESEAHKLYMYGSKAEISILLR